MLPSEGWPTHAHPQAHSWAPAAAWLSAPDTNCRACLVQIVFPAPPRPVPPHPRSSARRALTRACPCTACLPTQHTTIITEVSPSCRQEDGAGGWGCIAWEGCTSGHSVLLGATLSLSNCFPPCLLSTLSLSSTPTCPSHVPSGLGAQNPGQVKPRAPLAGELYSMGGQGGSGQQAAVNAVGLRASRPGQAFLPALFPGRARYRVMFSQE